MMPKLNHLWIVQTSNNLGSFDDEDDVFFTKDAAEVEAHALAAERHGNRSDYVVSLLVDAIRERVRSAESSAMEEG